MCHLHVFLILPVIEFVIHESVEKAGLTHPAVAQDQELEQVIVVHFGMCKPNFELIYSSTQNLVREKTISTRISLSTTEFAMSHFAAAWTTTLLLKSFFFLCHVTPSCFCFKVTNALVIFVVVTLHAHLPQTLKKQVIFLRTFFGSVQTQLQTLS